VIGSPSPRPGVAYQLLRAAFALVGRLLFRIRVSGLENLPRTPDGRPAGGWICCGLPHRTWVEPFILLFVLPARPRLVMLADGRTVAGSWWRRLLTGRLGGVIPVSPASSRAAFGGHVEAARQAIRGGAVFGLFPEVGPPIAPPDLRRLSPGIAHFALATGAPVVPVVFGGTHELFLRRRIEVRVMPRLEPPVGSTAEGAAVAQLMAQLGQSVEPVIAAAHRAAEPPAGTRQIWRWLTGPYPRPD
jgi:1-acyl-sn-glycerol-3-phosphate acyltransferase